MPWRAAARRTRSRRPGRNRPGPRRRLRRAWLGNVPLHADTAGARIRDGYLYVTSSHELTIYDIADPVNPVPVSTLPIPQQPYFAEEDVDTNGKVLLIGTMQSLLVIDVRDKTLPKLTGILQRSTGQTLPDAD